MCGRWLVARSRRKARWISSSRMRRCSQRRNSASCTSRTGMTGSSVMVRGDIGLGVRDQSPNAHATTDSQSQKGQASRPGRDEFRPVLLDMSEFVFDGEAGRIAEVHVFDADADAGEAVAHFTARFDEALRARQPETEP